MQILLTRPEGDNRTLASSLEEKGMTVSIVPLITILPLELGDKEQQLVQALETFHAAIFVSRNAVKHSMSLINSHWPSLPQGLVVYAVGPGTAAALADYDVAAVTPETPGSEGLLALPGLNAVQDKKILILRGLGGRELLQDQLIARGAQVACLESYERVPSSPANGLPPNAGQDEQLLVVLTSGDMLASFVATAKDKLRQYIALVPSPRVADLARQHPFKKIVNAGAASDKALYDAICKIHAGQTKG